VFHHADSACFVIRPSRGKTRNFLGEFRPEVWVSDRLAAQMGWASKDHQGCLAHLLRDIQSAIDAGDDAFAPGMKALLRRASAVALADPTLAAYHSRLQTRLDELLKIVPDTKAGQKLQRIISASGRTCSSSSPTATFRLRTTAPSRPCVVFRKVTNCFRSQWGAQLYANVRSVVGPSGNAAGDKPRDED
jgi:transposase